MSSITRWPATWLPRSARTRLLVLLAALAAATALPGILYINNVYSGRLLQERQAHMRDLAQATAVVLSANLRERLREVDYLAATADFRQESQGGKPVTQSLEALKRTHPYYAWIGFADTQGQVRFATGDQLLAISVAARPWFSNGSRAAYIGDLHEAKLLAPLLPAGPDGPPRFIDFAAPVIGADGKLRGVLAAHAHWAWADEVMGTVLPLDSQGQKVEVMIVNRNGEVLFPGQPGKVRLDLAAEATRSGPGQDGASSFLLAKVPVPEVTPGTPLGWQVVVRQPLDAALRDVADIRQALILSALAAAGFFMALAWWVASLATRPLRMVAQLAQRIEQGEENLRLRIPTGSREIDNMVGALCNMAGMLVQRRTELLQANDRLEQRVAERTESLHRLNSELHRLARVDTLTGLANRLCANEKLQEEFARMRRTGNGYGVLVIDVDHFKRINDTFGHEAGDRVLQHLAATLRSALRGSDFVARMGGEEFLVVLPDTDLSGVVEAASKLCETVRQAAVPAGVQRVTVSIGAAQASPRHTDPDEALREADRWLYAAKDSGRDRVGHGPLPATADR